ncbi:MAG: hypothetical protein KDE59_02845 [Anaerolineales bacterium]|nr:hypothetical protein [Anaerolineales bacterium]MCB0008967.1 hypothetical protein [Anaerolineales bacterium]MCB0014305.1 hypothetical protein [Anaerolineales bacterium]MCB8961189.1 hypothetical protein [Ardenticatenales bacterium]
MADETAARVEAAIAELDKVREEWLNRPDVVGCDVGFNYANGVRSDEIVIRVHVHRSDNENAMAPFPEELSGIPVIVIPANYGFADDVSL